MRSIRALLVLLLTALFCPATAQYYVVGQDPASLRWRQINTPNFQIIYPENFEQNAMRLTSILEKTYQFAGKTLNHQPRKISVILHTQTVRSNGFAAWAPARVEMFTVPGQSMYPQSWLEQLAIHEYRHVVQISKVGSELPRIFKIILGEQAASIAIGAYLPFWFLEGDAVATETALSNSGRGRQPSFEMELKAQVQQKGLYSYNKAYLGSYKDYIPDYYQLGYQLVAHGRKYYGEQFWADIVHRVSRKPLSLVPFSKGIKVATGKTLSQFYEEAFSRWNNDTSQWIVDSNLNRYKAWTTQSKSYTSYRFPFYVNDTLIIALRQMLSDIPRFVTINEQGTENVFFTPGAVMDASVDFKNGWLIWTEVKPDPRWRFRENTLLRILKYQGKELKEKVFHQRIYAPSLSPDGKLISAVKIDEHNNSFLVTLRLTDLQIESEIPIDQGFQLLTPSWSEDGTSIYAVLLGEKGKSIVLIDRKTGSINEVTPFSYHDVSKPFAYNNHLYFTSNLTGLDNGFRIDLASKSIYQITDCQYGISDMQASPDRNKIIFSDYQSTGFRLVQQTLNSGEQLQHSLEKPTPYPLAELLSKQEGAINFQDSDTIHHYSSKRYSKLGHLFNFHSWAPIHVDTEEENVNAGFSLLSQNKLSTAVTELGYRYSSIDRTGKWVAKFEYSGLYPIIKIDADFGNLKSKYYQITQYKNQYGEVVNTDTTLVSFSYKLININSSIRIPIELTRGKIYRLLQPELQIGYSHYFQEKQTPDAIFRGSIIPVQYSLYFHNLLRRSHRDLQPRWGQIVQAQFRHTPLGNRDMGKAWSLEGIGYFPGLLRNHGLKIYGGYQSCLDDDCQMVNFINFPRGYESVLNSKMLSIHSDYTMPIAYPDWSLGRMLYLKRLYGRLFFDYSQATVPTLEGNQPINLDMKSTGGEIYAETHLLRFKAPVKLGYRMSYQINNAAVRNEFFFSINFSSL